MRIAGRIPIGHILVQQVRTGNLKPERNRRLCSLRARGFRRLGALIKLRMFGLDQPAHI
jgi:hypothetical protein